MTGEKDAPLNETALQAAVIEGSNIADEYLVRKIVTAYLGALPDAPAEMPGVEEIARAIARNVDEERFADAPAFQSAARAILALFAPILAEKEREIEKLECDVAYYVDGNAVERIKHEGAVKRGLMVLEAKNEWRDRALAAEAALAELKKQMLADEGQHRDALAAERERCAKIAEDPAHTLDFRARATIAAAIRAQGE